MLGGSCRFICSTHWFLGLPVACLLQIPTAHLSWPCLLLAGICLLHFEYAVCQISLFLPPWSCGVVSAASYSPYLTKALSVALSEGERLGLLSGGVTQAFKSCCPIFRWQYLFFFSRVLVSSFRSGCNPNLCRDPILRLVQMLTQQRQLCSSWDGSDSFCVWRQLCKLAKDPGYIGQFLMQPF